jgi:AcrR family transcriptional regulator
MFQAEEKQRLRAPSARSLETRERIADAAERLFAARGFEGTSLRDIATEAGVRVGLVSHHAGNKAALFHFAVGRRADELARCRVDALNARRADGPLTVEGVLRSYIEPFLELARTGGAQWQAYARLVAYVSADERWRSLTEVCFDPTAQLFVGELAKLRPGVSHDRAAGALVYMVAALLAQITSSWRIGALGDGDSDGRAEEEALIAFCVAGVEAMLGEAGRG